MIEKGLIIHIGKILINKKLQTSSSAYNVLTQLMIYFN